MTPATMAGPKGRMELGMVLIALGLILTLGQARVLDLEGLGRFWPLFLIGIGIVKLRQPLEDGQRAVGVALLFAGGFFQVIGLLTWGRAWPLALVFVGGLLMWQAVDRPGAPPLPQPSSPFISELALMGGSKRSLRIPRSPGRLHHRGDGGRGAGPAEVQDGRLRRHPRRGGRLGRDRPQGPGRLEGRGTRGAAHGRVRGQDAGARGIGQGAPARRARLRDHGWRRRSATEVHPILLDGRGGSRPTPRPRCPWPRHDRAAHARSAPRFRPWPAVGLAVPLAAASLWSFSFPSRYVCRALPVREAPAVAPRWPPTASGALFTGSAWVYLGAGLARFAASYRPESRPPRALSGAGAEPARRSERSSTSGRRFPALHAARRGGHAAGRAAVPGADRARARSGAARAARPRCIPISSSTA